MEVYRYGSRGLEFLRVDGDLGSQASDRFPELSNPTLVDRAFP